MLRKTGGAHGQGETLYRVVARGSRQKTLADAIADGGITVIGNTAPLTDFWGLLVDFKSGIPLVVPR